MGAELFEGYGTKDIQSFQSGFGNILSPQDPFMDGKVATEINGVWKANNIQTFKPELAGKWFATPIPYPQDRRTWPDIRC